MNDINLGIRALNKLFGTVFSSLNIEFIQNLRKILHISIRILIERVNSLHKGFRRLTPFPIFSKSHSDFHLNFFEFLNKSTTTERSDAVKHNSE